MEKIIKLTETDIKNAIKDVLGEASINAKKRNIANDRNTCVRKAINNSINETSNTRWPMRMWNRYVVLEHDSNTKIKNGVINRVGQESNHYSKNSDMGNYFWATLPGRDQSNGKKYRYYCLVEP